MSPFEIDRQLRLLEHGAAQLVDREELRGKLARGRPLVVKAGFDPSAPDIHLGHLVVMRKMREFQELGHDVVFVVGDFTARIGDPSGRSKTRPALSEEQVRDNAETYREQALRILDPARTRLEFNSTWLTPLGSDGWVRLAAKMTVARMLERDDFSKRYRAQAPISIHEFLYPLAQAYDSVALRADVELGGTDQTFNLLVGRDIMREFGLEPQVVLTTPLLVGLDGREKMSKSLANHIGILEPPAEMYGKLMSISDELMWNYYDLLIDLPAGELARIREDCHPMKAKQDLAYRVLRDLHGEEPAGQAADAFARVFRHREAPETMDEKELKAGGSPLPLPRLLVAAALAPSTSEARRLIVSGAVHLDGVRVTDPAHSIEPAGGASHQIKVGKHRFLRVRFV